MPPKSLKVTRSLGSPEFAADAVPDSDLKALVAYRARPGIMHLDLLRAFDDASIRIVAYRYIGGAFASPIDRRHRERPSDDQDDALSAEWRPCELGAALAGSAVVSSLKRGQNVGYQGYPLMFLRPGREWW